MTKEPKDDGKAASGGGAGRSPRGRDKGGSARATKGPDKQPRGKDKPDGRKK